MTFLPPAYVVRREGNVFTGVSLSVHVGGGESQALSLISSPSSFSGGHPSPRFFPWSRVFGPFLGYPREDRCTSQLGLGYPLAGTGEPLAGYPSAGTGLPPGWEWGIHPIGTEQHSEYLLRAERYASYSHAGVFHWLTD